MSGTPTLSLVLPVYNVAPWLPMCLDSLLAQTRPADEIIAVDDGSSDDSPEILSRYAARHPAIRVIRQENGGLSCARNTGLAAARGRYVAFVDSDDFVAPGLYATLLAMAEGDDLDMALCNAWFHFEGRQPDRVIYTELPEQETTSGSTWLKQRLTAKRLAHMVWMHLYRTEFLRQHAFTFVPGQVHEDVVWTNQVLLAARRVRYTSEPLYYYRSRPTPRSGSDRVRRSREYVIPCSVTNTREIVRMANTIKDDSELAALMRWQAVDSGFAVFHLIEKLPGRAERLTHYRNLWREGFYQLMWENAQSFRQRKKIVRLALRLGLRLV